MKKNKYQTCALYKYVVTIFFIFSYGKSATLLLAAFDTKKPYTNIPLKTSVNYHYEGKYLTKDALEKREQELHDLRIQYFKMDQTDVSILTKKTFLAACKNNDMRTVLDIYQANALCPNRLKSLIEQSDEKHIGFLNQTRVYYTPFDYAIENKNPEMMALLQEIQAYINPFAFNQQALRVSLGDTPLHTAIRQRQRNIIFLAKKDWLNSLNHYGVSPLEVAVSQDDYAITLDLLKAGANPNTRNIVGQSPLHIAILRHSFKMVILLLKYKTHLDIETNRGKTLLEYAQHELDCAYEARNAHIKKANPHFFEQAEKIYFLMHVLSYFKYAALYPLTESRSTPVKQWTPLHEAAAINNIANLKKCLDFEDFDINAHDENNQTPLHIAIRNLSYDACFYLLGHGAQFDIKSYDVVSKKYLYPDEYCQLRAQEYEDQQLKILQAIISALRMYFASEKSEQKYILLPNPHSE